jgi:hypothetical protein
MERVNTEVLLKNLRQILNLGSEFKRIHDNANVLPGKVKEELKTMLSNKQT